MGGVLGGIGGSESKTDVTSGSATDQGQSAVRSTIANPQSMAAGRDFRYDASITVGQGGDLIVNDPQGIMDLSKLFANTVSNVSSAGTANLNEAIASMGDQLKNAFGSLSKLSESAQTGGDSGRNNIILWIVLGLFGLLAIFLWKR